MATNDANQALADHASEIARVALVNRAVNQLRAYLAYRTRTDPGRGASGRLDRKAGQAKVNSAVVCLIEIATQAGPITQPLSKQADQLAFALRPQLRLCIAPINRSPALSVPFVPSISDLPVYARANA